MKTKKIVTLVLITFLLSFAQKSFAQDWTHWFTDNQVYFYYKLVPQQGGNDAYYKVKTVNGSREVKSIYYWPVFKIGQTVTVSFAKKYFHLSSGKVEVSKFIINTQAKIQSGNKVPYLNLKEYSVKKY